jgi:hypothetical protein
MHSRFLRKSVLVSKNISLLRGEFFLDNCWSYWVKQQQLGQPAAASHTSIISPHQQQQHCNPHLQP